MTRTLFGDLFHVNRCRAGSWMCLREELWLGRRTQASAAPRAATPAKSEGPSPSSRPGGGARWDPPVHGPMLYPRSQALAAEAPTVHLTGPELSVPPAAVRPGRPAPGQTSGALCGCPHPTTHPYPTSPSMARQDARPPTDTHPPAEVSAQRPCRAAGPGFLLTCSRGAAHAHLCVSNSDDPQLSQLNPRLKVRRSIWGQ